MGSWTRGGLVKSATAQFNSGVVACVGREDSDTTAQFNGGWGRGHVVDLVKHATAQFNGGMVVCVGREDSNTTAQFNGGVMDTWWIGQACNCTVQRWDGGMCGELIVASRYWLLIAAGQTFAVRSL